MILIERMARFLREHPKATFCDQCLLELLDMASIANVGRLSSALGNTAEFELRSGRCSICAREQTVVQALPNTATHPLVLLGDAETKRRAVFSDEAIHPLAEASGKTEALMRNSLNASW